MEVRDDEAKLALMMQPVFDAFFSDRGLQYLVDQFSEILGHPILVHDLSFRVLACSHGAYDVINIVEDSSGARYMDKDTIQYIRENNVFERLRLGGGSDYINKKRKGHGTSVSIIKINRIEVAHFAVYEAGSPFTVEELKLAEKFNKILAAELQKIHLIPAKNGVAHNYLLSDLLRGKSMEQEEVIHKLHYLRWAKASKLWIIVISNENEIPLDTKIPLVMQWIETFIPMENCITYLSDIVVFADFNLFSSLVNQNEFRLFLKSNNLCAGVSLPFSALTECKLHYQQALTALKVNRKKKAGLMLFSECRMQILSDFIAENYEIESFLHPAVIFLYQYDQKNESDLLKTLEKYIYFYHSPNDAASDLNIHRNTLFYRINKIRELTNISLQYGDEIMHIYFSIKLINISIGFNYT